MIIKPTFSVRVNLAGAGSLDYSAAVCDHDSAGGTDDNLVGNVTASGATAIIPGVTAKQRQLRSISLVNRGVASLSLSVEMFDGTTAYKVTPAITLQSGEQWAYSDVDARWIITTVQGVQRQTEGVAVVATLRASARKVGSAPEAAGRYYSFSKDSGFPGAWSPGTPGLAGRATNGTSAADAGCIPIPNAGAGQASYLASLAATATVAQAVFIHDFLLVSTGIVVTTTTAQTLNTVALPARDADGATAGRGVQAALLITTATTNAGAITTISMSYTNSDGVAGRTATIPNFPATAVIGTLEPFNLQAGDKGVQSVQSITLGTTLGGGAVALLLYQPLALAPVPLANAGAVLPNPSGARLYDGVCAQIVSLATGTTASTVDLGLAIEVRA